MAPPWMVPLVSSLLLGSSPSESPVSRLKVEGGVDVYHGYNFNRPASGSNFLPGTGTTALRDNAFSLNLASLGVSLAPEPVGFHVLLGVGTSLEGVHAGEPVGTGIGPEVWRLIQQASVSYSQGPLSLEAGLYPSHIGLEVLPSQGNWTYTRSWMGEWSPYYQAGLKGTWTFSKEWSAQLHLLNGWQNLGENGAQGDSGLRLFGDLVVSWRATEALSLAATADVGTQRRPGRSAAFWSAAALHARLQVAPSVAVAARAELFDDRGGLISGTVQRLVEGTLTLEVRPVDPLVLKLEARHDRSSANVFEGPDEPRPFQTLVVAGVTAFF
jgi:hypothetical protein